MWDESVISIGLLNLLLHRRLAGDTRTGKHDSTGKTKGTWVDRYTFPQALA